MRHRVHGRKLGRTTAHRKAMFRNQLTALFTHERITTTVAKAKELRPMAEKMVTLARTGTLANRRRVLTMVPDKEIVRRLFDDIAPRFTDRNGGYTRIMRLGPRQGDGAEMAIIEFIDFHPEKKGESRGGDKGSLMDRAKGLFGGGRAKAPAEAAPAETPAEQKSEEKAEPAVEAAAAEVEAEAETAEATAEPSEAETAEATADEAAEASEAETAEPAPEASEDEKKD